MVCTGCANITIYGSLTTYVHLFQNFFSDIDHSLPDVNADGEWDWYSVCQGRSETNFTKVKGGERAEKSRVKSVAAYGGRLIATASDAGLVKLWSFKKTK